MKAVAERYGVTPDSIRRHRMEHLPEKLLRAQDAQEQADADLLSGELESEKQDIRRLKDKAEAAEDYRTALYATDKALKALELQAKLAELIDSSQTINLYLNPQFIELKAVIVEALEPYPAARRAVAEKLFELGAGTHQGEPRLQGQGQLRELGR